MDEREELPLFLTKTFDSSRLLEIKMGGWQVNDHEKKLESIKEKRFKVHGIWFDIIHFNVISLIFKSYISNKSKVSQKNFSLIFEILYCFQELNSINTVPWIISIRTSIQQENPLLHWWDAHLTSNYSNQKWLQSRMSYSISPSQNSTDGIFIVSFFLNIPVAVI